MADATTEAVGEQVAPAATTDLTPEESARLESLFPDTQDAPASESQTPTTDAPAAEPDAQVAADSPTGADDEAEAESPEPETDGADASQEGVHDATDETHGQEADVPEDTPSLLQEVLADARKFEHDVARAVGYYGSRP